VVSDATEQEELFDVECPHCHRRFRAELLGVQSSGRAGFKCPHCRLFVAFERTADPDETAG
jgi:transposase-like protein